MRGYAALGVEGVSKARNAGAVIRTAHAFGASFAFLVGGANSQREIAQTDTSKAMEQMPLYLFDGLEDFALPESCSLVGMRSPMMPMTCRVSVIPAQRLYPWW